MTDTMTAQTKAEALETSILLWQENVKAETWGEVRMWVDDCSLCKMFEHFNCGGCQVYLRTGLRDCRGSPYDAAYAALREWGHTNPDDKPAWLAARDAFRRRAQAEVDFLISLRETEERQ